MSMSCLTDELLSDGASRGDFRMLRTGDEANAGDPSAWRKTCKFTRTILLSCSTESAPSTRDRRRRRTLECTLPSVEPSLEGSVSLPRSPQDGVVVSLA
jgi:hypothetical protein